MNNTAVSIVILVPVAFFSYLAVTNVLNNSLYLNSTFLVGAVLCLLIGLPITFLAKLQNQKSPSDLMALLFCSPLVFLIAWSVIFPHVFEGSLHL